jgi:hypothetical protein
MLGNDNKLKITANQNLGVGWRTLLDVAMPRLYVGGKEDGQ